MIKKTGILALVVCLFLVLLSPGLAQAEGELTILDSSAQVEFPSMLSFNLSAESDVDITDIRLRYTVERVSFAEVVSEVYVEFVHAPAVDIEWAFDLKKVGGLPPGSVIDYWWVVKDARGDEVETAPTQLQFDDNRYSWRSLSEGEITIYWYGEDESFAEELMVAAQQALGRLEENTGARLERTARLYIYADAADLQGAMIYPQEWTGGVAFTRHSTIAIGIASNNIDWGKRAIAHELTHLVVHQVALNPYNDLPAWLDEGLAMSSEGPPESWYSDYIDEAIAGDGLISVRSLSSPFSAYAAQARLSYAQSYSIVQFLVNNYGSDKMLGLLNAFREGNTYDGALEKVYGFDMDGLDMLWRDYITAPATAGETW